MKAVVQRVSSATVRVDGREVGSIGGGLLVYLGVLKGDGEREARRLASKIAHLRIFPDESRGMNRSLIDSGGNSLVISQFTLAARTEKGNRPSFSDAEIGQVAERLYELFLSELRSHGILVKSGVFGAMMEVESINDGPVTIPMEVTAAR